MTMAATDLSRLMTVTVLSNALSHERLRKGVVVRHRLVTATAATAGHCHPRSVQRQAAR